MYDAFKRILKFKHEIISEIQIMQCFEIVWSNMCHGGNLMKRAKECDGLVKDGEGK